jgi:hypothetical protein
LGFATLNPTYKEMAKVLSQKPGFFFSREKPDLGGYRNRVSQHFFSFILTVKGETQFLFIAQREDVTTFLITQTLNFIDFSFFLLPSSFFLLPSSFFLLPSSFCYREFLSFI